MSAGKSYAASNCIMLICWNVGVEPPDAVKVKDCAKLEAWIDVRQDVVTLHNQKPVDIALDVLSDNFKNLIGKPPKILFDPVHDAAKSEIAAMRVQVGDERMVVYYNGHGCPNMTKFGELWFFDDRHTQYVPISVVELGKRIKSPTTYIIDAACAGHVVSFWSKIAKPNDILIVSSRQNEILPISHTLPADLLTSCLTTPVRMCIEWWFIQSDTHATLLNHIDRASVNWEGLGNEYNRNTVLGDLGLVLTATTESICWNRVNKATFIKLFYQDISGSIIRNYLICERIMPKCDSNPSMHPILLDSKSPCTAHNWKTFEFYLDIFMESITTSPIRVSYRYFEAELNLFESWIQHPLRKQKDSYEKLPAVMRALFSAHKIRALMLLFRYIKTCDAAQVCVQCGVCIHLKELIYGCNETQLQEISPYVVTLYYYIYALQRSVADLHPKIFEMVYNILVKYSEERAETSLVILGTKKLEETIEEGIQHFVETVNPVTKGMGLFLLCELLDADATGEVAQKVWNKGLISRAFIILSRKSTGREESECRNKTWAVALIQRVATRIPTAAVFILEKRWETYIMQQFTSTDYVLRAASVYCLGRLLTAGDSTALCPVRVPTTGESEVRGRVDTFTWIEMCRNVVCDASPMVRLSLAPALQYFQKVYGKALESSLPPLPQSLIHASMPRPMSEYESYQNPQTSSQLNRSVPYNSPSAIKDHTNIVYKAFETPLTVVTDQKPVPRLMPSDTTKKRMGDDVLRVFQYLSTDPCSAVVSEINRCKDVFAEKKPPETLQIMSTWENDLISRCRDGLSIHNEDSDDDEVTPISSKSTRVDWSNFINPNHVVSASFSPVRPDVLHILDTNGIFRSFDGKLRTELQAHYKNPPPLTHLAFGNHVAFGNRFGTLSVMGWRPEFSDLDAEMITRDIPWNNGDLKRFCMTHKDGVIYTSNSKGVINFYDTAAQMCTNRCIVRGSKNSLTTYIGDDGYDGLILGNEEGSCFYGDRRVNSKEAILNFKEVGGGEKRPVVWAGFASNQTRLLVCRTTSITLYDVRFQNKVEKEIKLKMVKSCSRSADGLLAVSNDGSITIYDNDFHVRSTLKSNGIVAFHPTESIVFAGSSLLSVVTQSQKLGLEMAWRQYHDAS